MQRRSHDNSKVSLVAKDSRAPVPSQFLTRDICVVIHSPRARKHAVGPLVLMSGVFNPDICWSSSPSMLTTHCWCPPDFCGFHKLRLPLQILDLLNRTGLITQVLLLFSLVSSMSIQSTALHHGWFITWVMSYRSLTSRLSMRRTRSILSSLIVKGTLKSLSMISSML